MPAPIIITLETALAERRLLLTVLAAARDVHDDHFIRKDRPAMAALDHALRGAAALATDE